MISYPPVQDAVKVLLEVQINKPFSLIHFSSVVGEGFSFLAENSSADGTGDRVMGCRMPGALCNWLGSASAAQEDEDR